MWMVSTLNRHKQGYTGHVLNGGRRTCFSDCKCLSCKCLTFICGRNSVVECQLPKLDVVGSNPIARFHKCQFYNMLRHVEPTTTVVDCSRTSPEPVRKQAAKSWK